MEDLAMLLCSCFTWSTLYFMLCLLNPKRSYEWHIRTVTTIHALTVTVLGFYSIFVLGPWPLSEMGGPTSPFQQFIVAVSLGYFLLDLSWCLYFGTEGLVMLLHHTLSIAGLSVTYCMKVYGIEIVTTIFGAEITNPLLQLRWFLKATNNYDTLLGDIVDIAFMVSFGVFRIGVGSVLLYYHYTMDTTDWLSRFGGTCIYSVGWLFWVSIVQYGIKKYRKKYRKSHSKKNADAAESITNDTVIANGHTVERINGVVNGNGALMSEINGNLHKRRVTNGTDKPLESEI